MSVFKIMRDACKEMADLPKRNSRTFGFRMHWCECLHIIHVITDLLYKNCEKLSDH